MFVLSLSPPNEGRLFIGPDHSVNEVYVHLIPVHSARVVSPTNPTTERKHVSGSLETPDDILRWKQGEVCRFYLLLPDVIGSVPPKTCPDTQKHEKTESRGNHPLIEVAKSGHASESS